MRMRRFEFAGPSSLAEALKLLKEAGDGGKVIAGGTDLVVQMKGKLISPRLVVSLLGVPELGGLREEGKGLRIGALVRHADLERSPLVQGKWGILASAAHKVGSPQIRNLGTVGGNLGNASPCADLAPPLLVLEAETTLTSGRGERRVALDSFFTGPGITILEKDVILKEIWVPAVPPNSTGVYLKMGRRKSLDLSLASAAVLLTLAPGTRACKKARVALGAVSPTPMRAKESEKILEGKELNDGVIREAAEKAQQECSPISDIRATAEYRREMVRVLTERALKHCCGIPIPPTGI